MAYFTTSIAVVAGLCLAFAIMYLFIAARRPARRTQSLLFGLFSLAYAGAIMAARSSYMADTLGHYVAAQRVADIFASVGIPLIVWFVAAYTNWRPRLVLWVITGAYAIHGLVVILAPDLVINVSAGIEPVTLPWGETLLMATTNDATLFPIEAVVLISVMVYIVAANVRLYQSGARQEAIALAIGVGWFLFTVIEELIVNLVAIDFVFLADFGFLGFVLMMSMQMVNRAIETEDELLNYRNHLLEMVEEKSAELQGAQTLLLAQAEKEATTAERTRIARELHDAITQLLFSINLVASSLPQLWERDRVMAQRSTGELQRLTRGALAEMRILLRELRPQTIADTDLATLLTHLGQGLAARHDIPVEVRVEIPGPLSPEVHMALYRIAQEAMNNVTKHANASSVQVTLFGSASRLDLSIADDGYGFDTADVASGGSMGVGIMSERACEIGADLRISSELGIGTTVDLTWPSPTRSEIM